MELKRFPFDADGCESSGNDSWGKNWSVVYMINSKKEMYVGETSSFQERFRQHLRNPERKNLFDIIRLVGDEDFHKSYVLDIEQRLIRLCSADGKFKLQNRSAGQSAEHMYPQKKDCEKKMREIWGLMSNEELTDHSYDELINTNIFKFSPYTVLTKEQNDVAYNVLRQLLDDLQNKRPGTSIINGSAGTGKTIIALNMIFTIANIQRINHDVDFNSKDKWQVLIKEWKEYINTKGMPKIAFVVPMQSIRATLSQVVKEIGDGLQKNLIVGPSAIVKKKYDIVFVDESHRLKKRKNIMEYKSFDSCCAKLGLNPLKANQLDWIIKCCKHRVLFYDPLQSIKSADISPDEYKRSLGSDRLSKYYLLSQMRCLGGNDYIDYVKDAFDANLSQKKFFGTFEIKVYDDVENMVQDIKKKDASVGLCRTVAGFSWEWVTKKKTLDEIREKNLFDIQIGKYKYIWNTTDKNWILSPNATNEIGCVHTTQGYDLNFVGIIFGEEIDWDEKTGQIEVNLEKFFDKKVKAATSPVKVKEYIINAYRVMMTRGIKGCYMYACNPGMQKFLKKWF